MSTLDWAAKREAALERMTSSPAEDEGYRAQLVALADSHGGIYAQALNAMYAHEREALGAKETGERETRDRRLLTETREHDLSRRRERLVALVERRKAAYEQRHRAD